MPAASEAVANTAQIRTSSVLLPPKPPTTPSIMLKGSCGTSWPSANANHDPPRTTMATPKGDPSSICVKFFAEVLVSPGSSFPLLRNITLLRSRPRERCRFERAQYCGDGRGSRPSPPPTHLPGEHLQRKEEGRRAGGGAVSPFCRWGANIPPAAGDTNASAHPSKRDEHGWAGYSSSGIRSPKVCVPSVPSSTKTETHGDLPFLRGYPGFR